MFDELVESRPQRQRSTRQVVVSIAVHTVIIAVSIQLTRAVAETVTRVPRESETYRLLPPRPDVARAVSAPAPSVLMAAPAPVIVAAPLAIPASIPPVTLATGYDRSRFAQSGDSRMPIIGMPGDSLARDPIVTMQEVDDPVEYLSGQQPVYPPALRRVGVEGWVVLQYVVGVDGLVEPGSIKVTKSTNRLFEAPAIDAIKDAKFKAARVRGRKVRQLVDQIVRFTLR